MGRFEVDPGVDPKDSPEIAKIKQRAKDLGSNVVVVAYRGLPTQVFVGTNHAYERAASSTVAG